jgi:hypothetical protein
MSLIYKIEACPNNNCQLINIFDVTGIYNAISNPSGWGAPNPAISDATSSTLSVMYPGSVIPTVINTFPTLPNITNTPFVISNTNLTLAALIDGKYEFISHVVASGVDYYSNTTIYVLCGVECCVRKLLAGISTDRDCCMDDAKVEAALLAQTLLDGLKASAECGDFANADLILAELQKICAGTDCGCN